MTSELIDGDDGGLAAAPTERAARYLEMRKTALHLNNRMMRMDGLVHPLTAARAMGIDVSQKTIMFDAEWETDVLAEYSLYYHRSKGVRHFERVLDREELSEGERSFLEANRRAYVSVFEIEDSRPEHWELDLVDRLGTREPVTIIDRNASATLPPGLLLFARILAHDTFSSTSAVTLPVAASRADEGEREFVLRRCRAAQRSPGKRTPQHALFYICRKLYLRLGLAMEYR